MKIKHLRNILTLFHGFIKQFVSDHLSMILIFRCFYVSKSFLFYQIEETAVGTKFALVGSNLVVVYKEMKIIPFLSQTYPQDFIFYYEIILDF